MRREKERDQEKEEEKDENKEKFLDITKKDVGRSSTEGKGV